MTRYRAPGHPLYGSDQHPPERRSLLRTASRLVRLALFLLLLQTEGRGAEWTTLAALMGLSRHRLAGSAEPTVIAESDEAARHDRITMWCVMTLRALSLL